MRLLLDTQIVLWLVSNDRKLTDDARLLIDNADSRHVSAASIWEIAIKVRLGKLHADPDELNANLEPSGFRELPITSRHAVQAAKLPLHHGDPFDRMLVVQAMIEGLYLVTADRQLPQYSDLVILV